MVRLTAGDRRVDRLGGRWEAAAEWWGLAIAVVVTVAFGLVLPYEPVRVSVTVTNPTDHWLYINASTPDDDSLSFVLIAAPRSTGSAHDVVDRGPQWVLHLRTLGAPAGTVEVSRVDLLDGSFTIPIAINDDLAAAGVPARVADPATGV